MFLSCTKCAIKPDCDTLFFTYLDTLDGHEVLIEIPWSIFTLDTLDGREVLIEIPWSIFTMNTLDVREVLIEIPWSIFTMFTLDVREVLIEIPWSIFTMFTLDGPGWIERGAIVLDSSCPASYLNSGEYTRGNLLGGGGGVAFIPRSYTRPLQPLLNDMKDHRKYYRTAADKDGQIQTDSKL